MLRTVQLTPPPGDWTSYQIDERRPVDGKWIAVAARALPDDAPAAGFSARADFSQHTSSYRIVWVGEGGSKNMVIGEPQAFGEETAQVVGGLRVTR